MMDAVIQHAVAAAIDWHPIREVPATFKDGRDVLLWSGHPAVCLWCDGWRDPVGRLVRGVTHYADVEGPGS